MGQKVYSMDNWSKLSLREKRQLMNVFLDGGVYELDTMKKLYNNRYDDGGYKPSEKIKNYIKKIEGFRKDWYNDTSGVKTVGYGFTGKDFQQRYPNGMTREQADAEFEKTIRRFAGYVESLTPNFDKLSQNQKDALLSYVYNVGPGNFKNSSKLQAALANQDWQTAAQHMNIGYNDSRAPGLKRRRDYERSLFLGYKYLDNGQSDNQSFDNQSSDYWKNQYMKMLGAFTPAQTAEAPTYFTPRYEEKLFSSNTPLSDFTPISHYNNPIEQTPRRKQVVTQEQPSTSEISTSADILNNMFANINAIGEGNLFVTGGDKTVSSVWKERTGKDWSDVGNYYKDYDGSLQGNLKLLNQLNSGEYDYIKEGGVSKKEPLINWSFKRKDASVDNKSKDAFTDTQSLVSELPPEAQSVSEKSIGESVRDTMHNIKKGVKDTANEAVKSALTVPEVIFGNNEKYKDWRGTDVGDFVLNNDDMSGNGLFDLSQSIPPEEARRVYSKYVNGEPLTEWEAKECATFVTEVRLKNGEGTKNENSKFVSNNNYRGDAWTWLKNAKDQEDAGNEDVTVSYNMYDNGFSGNESKAEVISKTRAIAKTQEYKDTVMQNISPGSVVTLLYPGSGNFGKAAEAFKSGEGSTMSTHIGDVVEMNGQVYVRDNVGGRIHYRPLEKVLEGKDSSGVLITGIANYKGNEAKPYYDLSKFGLEVNMDVLRRPTVAANASAYRELDAIERNKSQLMSKYNISEGELKEFKKMALALSIQESFMGVNDAWKSSAGKTLPSKYWSEGERGFSKTSLESMVKPAAEKFSEGLASIFGEEDSAILKAESKGLSNIKYRGDRGDGKALFTLAELEKLGISKKDLEDKRVMESPEVSGVMTIVALKKKKMELEELMQGLPDDLRNDKDLLNALLLQSWNQGTKMIRKTIDNVKSGKSSPNALLQFKDPSLRPKNEKGEAKNWYVDDIIYNMSYYKDVETPLEKATSSRSLNNLSSEQVKQIQEELVNSGFLERVINNKEQIDGKIGPNTTKAFEKYLKSQDSKEYDKSNESSKKSSTKDRTSKEEFHPSNISFNFESDWFNGWKVGD